MLLSLLQKYILLLCLEQSGRVERKIFHQFYKNQDKKPSDKYEEGIISKSLERLIDRELMAGYGRRTPHKWFITHVKLTTKGVKTAQKLLKDRQKTLPLK